VLAVASATGCGHATASAEHGGVSVHLLRRAYNNVYVLGSGERVVLIDSGLPTQAAELEDGLREIGVEPEAVRAVVLTHGHADHAGSAAHFHAAYGAKVIAGAGERAMLAAGGEDNFCPTGALARWRLEEDSSNRYPPIEADVWVEDELDLAELAGIPARVVALPGHTPGSQVVVLGDAVFVGDLLRGSIVGSSAVVHFYICDLADNARDVRRVLDVIAPHATTIYPGHFGPLDRASVEALAAEHPGAAAGP
jgi:glyoxylase-like metal-dependent hydrolase (beta-lactamase superfamily II)